jgi:hypothetical protein
VTVGVTGHLAFGIRARNTDKIGYNCNRSCASWCCSARAFPAAMHSFPLDGKHLDELGSELTLLELANPSVRCYYRVCVCVACVVRSCGNLWSSPVRFRQHRILESAMSSNLSKTNG